MLGKWKATVQFFAMALAMFRPDVSFGGAYLDQWIMGVAVAITAWSGIDYLVKSAPGPARLSARRERPRRLRRWQGFS